MLSWVPRTALIITACIIVGCSHTISLRMQQTSPLPSKPAACLLAGVGKADITPRPGIPTAGYSANGNYGNGFRTRLHARVIYLKAVNARPVALVQCDLLAGSELVHRRLAELVARKTDLDMGGIMISGTHTHSGPSGLFGSNFYLVHAGNDGGLDRKYFDFMVRQIADAVIDAYNDRRPAKIASGSIEVYGFTRNRSILAYRANRNADPEKAGHIYKAVNPTMHMIRVDCLDRKSGSFVPAGALTSFSIHGTTIPSHNTLYNADVYAYMERELEWEVMRKHGAGGFVHAVVNGTHADNSPDNVPGRQGFRESRRLGVGLGQKAIGLFASLAGSLHSDVSVRSAIREIDYYQDNTIDGIALCDPPRVGMTLLAGVQDGGHTPVLTWLPFFREGSRRWVFTGGCHGNRRIFAWPFQSLILPRNGFPHTITYQVIRVGDVVLLPLPYEITMESGSRIVEACRKSGLEGDMDGNTQFVVISVSNGYTGYCTTLEEYGVQRYEGGHTIYGPNTNPFIAAQAAKLVSDCAKNGEVRDTPYEWTFDLAAKTFYREYDAPRGSRSMITEPVRGKVEDEEEYWAFSWADVPPILIDLHRPLISIEYNDKAGWSPLRKDGIAVDDEGYDISVSFTGRIIGETNLGVYETRWYNPESKDGRWYRFRIEPRQGQRVFFSRAFR